MGLFSTKKKVYVSSSVYKIIEDGETRHSFMQELVASTALSGDPNTGFGEAVAAALISGPRANQRAFFRWAKANFDLGMPRAAIDYNAVIDDDEVRDEIHDTVFSSDANIEVTVHQAFVDNADESYYAERYVYANRPELALLDWAADVDPDTNIIWIQYPPGTMYMGSPKVSDSFSEPSFNSSAGVLVAYYTSKDLTTEEVSTTQAYVYKLGDGNLALDGIRIVLTDGSSAREFYPFIPLRIDNKSVFETGSPALAEEELIRKAWKKALGNSMQEAIDEIDNNPDVGEVDYAYLGFGVSLNTDSKYEQEYLFEFFRVLAGSQGSEAGDLITYENINDALGGHARSFDGNPLLNTNAANDLTNPGYLTGVDEALITRAPQVTNVHLTLPGSTLGVLDLKITWADIKEELLTGVIAQGAKTGDITVTPSVKFTETNRLTFSAGDQISTSNVSGIVIAKQISSSQYIKVTCKGLLHKNLIYEGKSVDITAEEALADEDLSGFFVPLHEPTLKRLGGVKATEIARESYVLIFNSYQVVKKKWYQTGLFKFILAVIVIIIVVVISVLSYGTGTGPAAAGGSGILGANAAVGAALGFTGVVAIAVGAAANAIAAMLVLQLVAVGSEKLFGEKIGRILTLVVAIVLTLGVGANGFDFGNISNNIANMASMDKLLLMTNAAADMVGIFQEDQLEKILAETKKVTDNYEQQMKELQDLLDGVDFGKGIFDPMMLTDFTDPLEIIKNMGPDFKLPSSFGETPDQFLDRTLMSSSELIEMSNRMVTDFVDVTLTLQ